jgi:hypothetical protein
MTVAVSFQPRQQTTPATRRLLYLGAASGPLFLVSSGLNALLRPGFDLRRLALSALSLGPWGWTQILTFVLAGVLALGGAAGVYRALREHDPAVRAAHQLGPLLVAGYGTGLVIAGVFVTDPALGFPAGAPAGLPATLSWHAIVHSSAAALAFGSCLAACTVFARRHVKLGHRGRAWTNALAGTAIILIMAWPDQGSFGLRLALACVVTSAWLTWTTLLLTVVRPGPAHPDA